MKNQLLLGAITLGITTFGLNTTNVQALDLTGCVYGSILPGEECSGITNGGSAIFTAIDPDYASGTGVFEPFLTIHKKNTEEGFNTDATPLPLDATRPHWTNMVDFDSVDTSTGFVQLLLDWNEANDKDDPLLNLVDLEVYLSDTANIDDLNVLRSQTHIFTLGEDVFLRDQNAGQGRADLLVELSRDLFTGHSGQYFYLYSKFTSSDASFEEWSYKNVVPTPAAVLPVLGGLFGAAFRRQKKEQLS